MEIIGLHYHILDSVVCKIEIRDKKITVSPVNANDYSKIKKPSNSEKWNFRKVNWEENKPVEITSLSERGIEWVWKYSHVIEYMAENNHA